MIVVTTPTGDIGSKLLSNLLVRSSRNAEEIRVIARDPARLSAEALERVEVIVGSHGDPVVVDRAFEGADAVFWLIPPDRQSRSLYESYSGFSRAAVEAFATHRVGHVVGISSLGRGTTVEKEAGIVTAALEVDDLIGNSGVAYRALANAMFMENVLRQTNSIRDRGIYADTAQADQKAPLVSTRDVAAIAADFLLDRSWTGYESVPVLGPEDLSAHDMVAIMSQVLARPIRYEQGTLDGLRASLSGNGLGVAIVNGMVDMMRAKTLGYDLGIQRGSYPPNSTTTFRQWCDEVLRPAVLG